MNENVQERTPGQPVDLASLASQLLEEAQGADNGHAALTLTPSAGGPMKQTMVALRAGRALDPDHWNGVASLHVVTGTMTIAPLGQAVAAGQWAVIPDEDAEVAADQDAAALLTVAPPAPGGPDAAATTSTERDAGGDHLGPKPSADERTHADMGLG